MSSWDKKPFATLWPAHGEHLSKSPEIDIAQGESARGQVLRTHELLENIIIHLPWTSAFVNRRVSQVWNSVIQKSPATQDRMFLYSAYKPLIPISDLNFYGGGQVTYTAYRDKIAYINPLMPVQGLFYCPTPSSTTSPFANEWTSMDYSSGTQICISIIGIGLGKQRSYQSWRGMSLTEPPITALDLKILPSRYRHDHKKHLTVYNPEGLRLGELHDWIWKLCKEAERELGFTPFGNLAEISFCLISDEEESDVKTQQSD